MKPDDGCTREKHMAQHQEARQVFGEALRACVRAGHCVDVIMQEIVELLVQGAVERDRPLSEIVANVIDTYEDVRDTVVVVLERPTVEDKPHGN